VRIEDCQKFQDVKNRCKSFFADKSYEDGLIPDKDELLFEPGLKEYITAMVEWSSRYKINRGKNTPIDIKVFFVQSLRQYAEMLQPLRNSKADYPMVSVALTNIAPDYSRYIPHTHKAIGYIYKCDLNSDGKNIQMKNADIPVTLSFKVTMWGKLYDDMFQFNYRMTKQFHHGGISYISVNNGLCRLELKSVNDESTLENLSQSEERLLRWSYSIDCKAWLKEPLHDVKTVWEIPVTAVEESKNQYLDHYNHDLISKETKHEQ
jgi:hypothetical protein